MRVVLLNVQAHVVVALLAFLATSLAVGDAAHEGVVHHPHVMELLHMAPPSALIKRHLRSSPDATSMGTTGVEERAKLEESAAIAKEIEAKIVPRLSRLRWWWTKNPDTLFKALRLDKIKVDLLSNSKFLKWENLVTKENGIGAHRVIMNTMIRQCEDIVSEALVIFGAPSKLAGDLQQMLLTKWAKRGNNPEQILQDLNPGGDADALINSPLFKVWSKFTIYTGLSYRKDLDILTKAYTVPGVVQALDTATKRVIATDQIILVEDDFAEGLLQLQFRIWHDENLSEEQVLEKLQINKAAITSSESSAVGVWLDFVLMRTMRLNDDKFRSDYDIFVHYKAAVHSKLVNLSFESLLGQASTEWKKILQHKAGKVEFDAKYRRLSRALTRHFP